MSRSYRFLGALFIAAILLSGCSKAEWRARVSLFKAEQMFWKTHAQMKSNHVSFEARQPFYRKACKDYLKALDLAPRLFNSPRLEEASLSCSNAEDQEATAKIEQFYTQYCQSHPKECEFGGDMPAGGLEEY